MHEVQKVSSDFVAASNGLDTSAMSNAIWVDEAIPTLFLGMRTNNDGTDVTFVFDSVPAGSELTQLDVLIAAHTGKPAAITVLNAEILKAKEEVDACAGEARARYITVAPGQSAVYIEKEKQSKAFKDAGYPVDETGYEFVTANKNADGVTAQVAADTVLAIANGWKLIAAGIEEIRIGYKNQITAAVDINAVKALKNKAKALLDAI